MKRSCRGFDILSSSKLMLRPKTNKLRLKNKKYFQREERVCLCDCWPRPPRLMQVLNASQQSEHRFPTFAIFISGMRLAVSENFQQRPPNCSTLGPQKILVSYTLSQSFCSCLTTLLMLFVVCSPVPSRSASCRKSLTGRSPTVVPLCELHPIVSVF